ncbi:Photosystem I assembly protein Ycf3 [Pyrus ussuriensis x Pyrus communis]|uniref:Photosystem I assembly protein Ycf3 n=1 Tax=Pyrus ussuriensis x Pyrus communis TaxID=2448454 RepID=A0A5N5HBU5_9ROSA|nr:Photosystem I assembly protein Ycf3 [Pyrus ussuriensis x Pyrus communis]
MTTVTDVSSIRRKLCRSFTEYYEAMRLEIDPYDRSYILYNIGFIHTSNGEHTKALEYYFRALERNPFLPQAFNNMTVIYHYVVLFHYYIYIYIYIFLCLDFEIAKYNHPHKEC